MRALLIILSGSLLGLTGCGGWGSGPYGGRGYGMMGGYGGYGPFGMMGGGPFGMIMSGLFWLVIIAVVIWAIWHFTAGRSRVSKSDAETPLEILKKRLASGEITPEQFAKTKKTLDEKK
jgi:putative membrane protein